MSANIIKNNQKSSISFFYIQWFNIRSMQKPPNFVHLTPAQVVDVSPQCCCAGGDWLTPRSQSANYSKLKLFFRPPTNNGPAKISAFLRVVARVIFLPPAYLSHRPESHFRHAGCWNAAFWQLISSVRFKECSVGMRWWENLKVVDFFACLR